MKGLLSVFAAVLASFRSLLFSYIQIGLLREASVWLFCLDNA